MKSISEQTSDLRSTNPRRRFLKETGFGVVTLALAGCSPSGPDDTELPPGIREKLLFSDPTEFLVLRSAAEQLTGYSGESGEPSLDDIALRADAFLAGAEPEIQDQFHQLLTVFNSSIAAFLFDLRTSTFLGMTPEERASYLNDWMTSPIGFRRTAFQALKRVSMSVTYTHPAMWPSIGFDGVHTL